MSSNNKKLVKTIGEVVRKQRLITGKSISAVSAECAVPKATWREVEIGACNNITTTTLWKISEGLALPIDELFKEVKDLLGEDFTLIDE